MLSVVILQYIISIITKFSREMFKIVWLPENVNKANSNFYFEQGINIHNSVHNDMHYAYGHNIIFPM